MSRSRPNIQNLQSMAALDDTRLSVLCALGMGLCPHYFLLASASALGRLTLRSEPTSSPEPLVPLVFTSGSCRKKWEEHLITSVEGAATWEGSTNDKIPFQLPVFHFGLIEPFLRTQKGAMVIDSMLDGFRFCRWPGKLGTTYDNGWMRRTLFKCTSGPGTQEAGSSDPAPAQQTKDHRSELNQAAGPMELSLQLTGGRVRPCDKKGAQRQNSMVVRHLLIPVCMASVSRNLPYKVIMSLRMRRF